MSDLLTNPFEQLTPEEFDLAIKANQNRENAKASTGPKSPEGKAAAAQNARKHGFAGATVVIDDEDKQAYACHLDAYFDRFLPIDQVEADTVRRAANSMWKYDRLTTIESTLLELETEHQTPLADIALENPEPRHRWTLAFKEQSGERSLELCRRYLSGLQRDFDRAVNMFYKLKKERPAGADQPVPPPNPVTRKPKLEIVGPRNEASHPPSKSSNQPLPNRPALRSSSNWTANRNVFAAKAA